MSLLQTTSGKEEPNIVVMLKP